MINPFDKTFFKFLLGFILILLFSFSIFFFTGQNVDNSDIQAKPIEKTIQKTK
jgi:hypothetical protein